MKSVAILAMATCLSVPTLPQGEPGAALEAFVAAYRVADPAAVAMLFGPDSTFFGPTENDLHRGANAVRAYFTRAWPPGTLRNIACEGMSTLELPPASAVIAGTCRIEAPRPDGPPATASMRLTMVLAQEAAGWRIASMHMSAPPLRR